MTDAAEPGTGSVLDDWTWHKDDFAKTFGDRVPGRFRENWPANTRIAVALTFDTQGDIDAALPGRSNGRWPGYEDRINYVDLAMRQYDVLDGVPRVLRILAKHGVQATFPVSGMTCDWYPDTVREIASHGHEVAAHGYHHVLSIQLTPEQEREEIERATDAVARLLGAPPRGWRTPVYSTTEHTLDFLRDLDYQWHGDFHNADFPYVLRKNGRDIVEVPPSNDDWSLFLIGGPGMLRMGGTPYGTTEGVLGTLKAEFDVLYEESAEAPRMFQLCMHPSIIGRPFRAAVLDRLITYIEECDGVWFTTCTDLAALAF
jgi:peptidoglycan/xylan/chitin deacetylase (PgdA/CDA1 family)